MSGRMSHPPNSRATASTPSQRRTASPRRPQWSASSQSPWPACGPLEPPDFRPSCTGPSRTRVPPRATADGRDKTPKRDQVKAAVGPDLLISGSRDEWRGRRTRCRKASSSCRTRCGRRRGGFVLVPLLPGPRSGTPLVRDGNSGCRGAGCRHIRGRRRRAPGRARTVAGTALFALWILR